MSVAIQTAFVEALAQVADPVPVYRTTAPQDAPDRYVVYALIPGTQPHGHTYSGTFLEEDLYLVSCVARTETEAETLNERIVKSLDHYPLDGAKMVRRENRAPTPNPKPNQTRHRAATYIRVTYAGDIHVQ